MLKADIIVAARQALEELGIESDVQYAQQDADNAESWKVGFTTDLPQLTINYAAGEAFESLREKFKKELKAYSQNP